MNPVHSYYIFHSTPSRGGGRKKVADLDNLFLDCFWLLIASDTDVKFFNCIFHCTQTEKSQSSFLLGPVNAGSTKANGREPKTCFGWVFYYKLGCFEDMYETQVFGCTSTSVVENSAQVSSCELKFVRGQSQNQRWKCKLLPRLCDFMLLGDPFLTLIKQHVVSIFI